MYRITYMQGNGYHCHCCRTEHKCTVDMATKEEVIYWLSELEASKTIRLDCYDDSDDVSIKDICEVKEMPWWDEFKPNPEKVKEIIKERKKIIAEREEKAAQDEANSEKEKLRELLKKYPFVS